MQSEHTLGNPPPASSPATRQADVPSGELHDAVARGLRGSCHCICCATSRSQSLHSRLALLDYCHKSLMLTVLSYVARTRFAVNRSQQRRSGAGSTAAAICACGCGRATHSRLRGCPTAWCAEYCQRPIAAAAATTGTDACAKPCRYGLSLVVYSLPTGFVSTRWCLRIFASVRRYQQILTSTLRVSKLRSPVLRLQVRREPLRCRCHDLL
jgi:hypothetical protein